MKRFLFILLLILSTYFPFEVLAECNHYYNYYPNDYEYIDNNSHYAIYSCLSCGQPKKEKQAHDPDYNFSTYERIDANSHYNVYTCNVCGGKIKEKENHFYETPHYEKGSSKDPNYHFIVSKCVFCGATEKEKEKHKFNSIPEKYLNIDANSHFAVYNCSYCGATKKVKAKHNLVQAGYLRKAAIKTKGIYIYHCNDCPAEVNKAFNWRRGAGDSYSYDIDDYSTVYHYSKSITVKLNRGCKGATLKVKIGKKTYKKKLKNNKKKVKLKIKNPSTGSKISIKLYYKNKLIGTDKSNWWPRVRYAKKIGLGYTKKEAKYTWGSPSHTASVSGGWSYWYYDDGSYIVFKDGYIDRWYV